MKKSLLTLFLAALWSCFSCDLIFAKEINSVDDLVGFYKFTGYSFLNRSRGEQFRFVNIKTTELENQIVFQDFNDYGDIYATVDMEQRTVTFEYDPEMKWLPNYNTWLEMAPFERDENFQAIMEVDSVIAKIEDDGTLSFPEEAMISGYLFYTDPSTGQEVDGFYYLFGSWERTKMNFTPYGTWTFNEDEWTYGGKASFQDGWMAPALNMNINGADLVYDVDFYINNANNDIIVLDNPYGEGTLWTDSNIISADDQPYVLNISKTPGYIYINAKESNNVIVTGVGPVFSGFESEAFGKFYLYNIPGYYYEIYGADNYKLIMNEYGIRRSVREGNVITINDCCIGYGDDRVLDAGWNNYPHHSSIIILPEEYDGIDMINETENGSLHYYNLQGVELKSPEKGQLIIKKSGNKASKIIF